MKYNLGSGHRDFLFRKHEDTGVSNKMPFLFFDCGYVSELFITFGFGRQRAMKGESTGSPLQEVK